MLRGSTITHYVHGLWETTATEFPTEKTPLPESPRFRFHVFTLGTPQHNSLGKGSIENRHGMSFGEWLRRGNKYDEQIVLYIRV